MQGAMDEFVLNYTLQRIQKELDDHKLQSAEYQITNDQSLLALEGRVEGLEEYETETTGSINTLKELVEGLQKDLKETKNELNKTKMINIKQEIVVRTLHNLKTFNALDMYTDTFSDDTGVDWTKSVRASHLVEWQAVGKTRDSIAIVNQPQAPTYMLIGMNGSSDEAVQQTFMMDKDRELDKLSIYVEAFSADTYQPLIMSIKENPTGPALTSVDVTADSALGGWVDLEVPAYMMEAGKEYYLDIRTDDIYGYKIGMDPTDRYLAGTSLSLYNNVWTDNNYDIAFKIWCFPSADENDAIVYTNQVTLTTLPEYIVFEKDDTVIEGGIIYHVSRDGGLNWKLLQPSIETNLNDLPEGKDFVIRATITGDSRINAWGYVIKRSEV